MIPNIASSQRNQSIEHVVATATQPQEHISTVASASKCARNTLDRSPSPPTLKEREYAQLTHSEESKKVESAVSGRFPKPKLALEATLEARKFEHLAADVEVETTIPPADSYDNSDESSPFDSITVVENPISRNATPTNRLDIHGPEKIIKIKDKKKQEKANVAGNQCLAILRTDSKKVEFLLSSDENDDPIIDLVCITEESGKAILFNLLIDRGLKREGLQADRGLADLLEYHGVRKEKITEELLQEIRTKLKEPTKDLVKYGFPDGKLPGKSRFSERCIGNLNGGSFAQGASESFLKLLYPKSDAHLKKFITSTMSKSKLVDHVDDKIKLNENGAKAMKEIAALTILIKEKRDNLTLEKKRIKDEIEKREKDTVDRDPLDSDPEVTKKEQQLAAIEKKERELQSIPIFALAWHIQQLNQPIPLYHEDGKEEKMTMQEAINLPPSDSKLYVDKERTKQFDPVLYRHTMAEKSKDEFSEYASHESQSWYKPGTKTLSPEEKNAAFRVGAMFFHDGTEAESFRIRNMRYHETQNVPLTQDIPGASDLIHAAQNVVAVAELKKDTLPEGLVEPRVGKHAIKQIQQLNELTKSKETGTSAKPWTEMTPKEAAHAVYAFLG